MRKIKLVILLTLACAGVMSAQCPAENKAFKSGEELEYTLYFNWKFIWIKCGSATFRTRAAYYKGQDAYRCDLLFRTNEKFDAYFTLRDTLEGYVSKDLVPLYFYKASLEGKQHRLEKAWYSYPEGKCTVKLEYTNPNNEVYRKEVTKDNCMYDMMSMMAFARSFDANRFKEGDRLYFDMTSSDEVCRQTIIYRGKEKFKANDGITYRCMVFSMLDWEEKKKEREILRFYFSDDDNHLPVACNLYLNIGSARIYLTGYKNLKNPVKARIK